MPVGGTGQAFFVLATRTDPGAGEASPFHVSLRETPLQAPRLRSLAERPRGLTGPGLRGFEALSIRWPLQVLAPVLDPRDGIAEYIEIFTNRIRRHSTVGGVSPARFEEMARVKEAWAA